MQLPFEDRLETVETKVHLIVKSFYIHHIGDKLHDCTIDEDLTTIKDQFLKYKKLHNTPEFRTKIKRHDALIHMLLLIVKIHRELQSLDTFLLNEDFSKAATSVADANAMLEELMSFDDYPCPPDLYLSLRHDFLSKKALFKHRCHELFRSFFTFSKSSDSTDLAISHHISGSFGLSLLSQPLHLNEFLDILMAAGTLTKFLDTFCFEVMEYLIVPIKRQLGATVQMKMGKAGTMVKIVRQHGSVATRNSYEDVTSTLENALTISKHIFNTFFTNVKTPSIRDSLIDLFQPHFVPFIMTQVLQQSLPSDAIQMENFQTLISTVLDFDRTLKAEGCLRRECSDFTEFAANAHVLYAKTKRNGLAKRVREIVEDVSTNTVEAVSADAVGKKGMSHGKSNGKGGSSHDVKFPSCHISIQASAIMDIVKELLHEGMQSDKETALELFYCARDALDMYRALWPEVHAESIRADPARAMILCNDCDYFCWQMTGLGYSYKLGATVERIGTFGDLVPSFRKLGETYLRHQMEAKGSCEGDVGEGLGGMVGEIKYDAIEYAIESCVGHLLHLSKIWRPISQPELYLSAMGLLVDHFLKTLVDDVIPTSGESRQAVHHFRFLVGLVLKLETVFVKKGGAGGWEKVPVQQFVKQWPSLLETLTKVAT
ncbi:Centromere/kinetochore Zw10-domain-containing protein [Chytridium lagenaria]|nr:Centromere/kinetochore Zw10-domain-containing protein [Chytridium lagenaria]